ncbi:MAG: aminotransferase class V-fold PLP-dependent enzyme, partial [Actinomycetales bacterium]
LIDLLREQVPARVPDVEVVGDPVNRLPHVLTFSVLYVSGEALVGELDRAGFAVASGSACVAEEHRPSHVLAAMGAYTGGNIRITLPFGCSADTVHGFLAALAGAVGRLRAEVGR